jgi:SNF2 family DNA or RNA helicase
MFVWWEPRLLSQGKSCFCCQPILSILYNITTLIQDFVRLIAFSTPSSAEGEDTLKPSDFGIVLDKKSKDYEDGTGRQFMIKWECMNFLESSWEFERDLILAEVEYKDKLKDYYIKTKKPNKTQIKKTTKNAEEAMRRAYKLFGDKTDMKEEEREKEVQEYQKQLADVVFLNGGQLRDYQAEGVAWFLSNYVNNRSCILADEMGLGKVRVECRAVHILTFRCSLFIVVVSHLVVS